MDHDDRNAELLKSGEKKHMEKKSKKIFQRTWDIGFSNKRVVGRQTTGNFESVPREKFHQTFVNRKNEIPNCCSYRVRYRGVDKTVRGLSYGDERRWDKRLEFQSKERKDNDFDSRVRWDKRLERTLVHIRPNVIKQIIDKHEMKVGKK